MNYNKKLLQLAEKEIGIKEIKGKRENPRIRTYHKHSTIENDKEMSENVPWCSSFICFLVERAGLQSTDNKMARSWERMDFKKTTKHPLPGDIVTFWRKSKRSGFGHVGMYLKRTKNYVYILGGNQSDAVNIKRFSRAKMTGIWRVHDQKISQDQVVELRELARGIMSRHGYGSAGSVI